MADAPDITLLLADLDGGGREAVDRVLPLIYPELERLAHRHLRRERSAHTLDTSALVHEAYFRLVRQEQPIQNRAHFFGVAALAMRRILVNYAAQRSAEKRGGGEVLVTLIDGAVGREARTDELLALDEALDRLAAYAERPARVVEMWFFGGLRQDEIAEALGTSVATVRRDWQFAKAWLSRELADGPALPSGDAA